MQRRNANRVELEISHHCERRAAVPKLVRATQDISLRNGLHSRGVVDANAHRWGCVVPKGTIGIIEGDSKLGSSFKLISFENHFYAHGHVVTDHISNDQFEVID